ncbi:uncharacterized protein K452DRAFT_345190 [Aplosporella prunicola CBS 121167]|uniref:Uncharacterized protein n=1 Tax=Aplosporella prunicola CBS 121167 TaxID=1176127 RepID=A0A6A6AWM5_9PEZI|nr:uncharacterized protein K452DRAFT_345190 [Aplosporella prunicola CBS 121167]KAF2136006.1 hypothetical protein K452DRAFT_345190 [Aplosporella prunicola CBS 121167]
MGDILLSRHSSLSQQPQETNDFEIQLIGTSDSIADQPTNKAKWYSQQSLSMWTIEVLSFALAVIALMAILITLLIHDNQPLPQWPHLISINSLIATFTAIFKACMLLPVVEGISQFKWLWFSKPQQLADIERLDLASRGPWGALRLLFNYCIGRRGYHLASFGAVITIASLAIDPFSQEIIKYHSCLQPVDGMKAQIPRTNNYHIHGPPGGINSVGNELDSSIQLAFYTGLFSSLANASAPLAVKCLTKNCTFAEEDSGAFQTLAICHSCQDISNEVTWNSSAKEYELPVFSRENRSISLTPCNDSKCKAYSISSHHPAPSNLWEIEALLRKNHSDCWQEPCSPTPFAVGCSLRPCLKTYGANVTNGDYKEIERGVEFLASDEDGDFSLASKQILRDGKWRDCEKSQEYSENTPVLVDLRDKTIHGRKLDTYYMRPHYPPEKVWYPRDCVWNMDYYTSRAIRDFLSGMYNGNQLYHYPSEDVNIIYSNIWLQLLYQNGSATMDTVNSYWKNIAEAMTAQIRHSATGPESTRYAFGKAWSQQTCIHVRWAWISFPAMLMVLSFCFFVAVMFQSWENEWKGDWKSSALAPIFHGLGQGCDLQESKMMKDDMYSTSKDMRVRLQRRGSGWQLIDVEEIKEKTPQPQSNKTGMRLRSQTL